jgi:hypothetical protein
MVNLGNIQLEYKVSALFGLSAFVMSLLTGIILGINWNTAVLRSVILMATFAGIGFGICAVLKRFVPEVYEFFVSIAMPAKAEIDEPVADERVEQTTTEQNNEGAVSVQTAEGVPDATQPKTEASFNELDKDMLAQYASSPGRTGGINTAAGKLGKHVLKTEKLAKYEPKIMAQAVRTMMNKDQ